jgi:hypothetical protein
MRICNNHRGFVGLSVKRPLKSLLIGVLVALCFLACKKNMPLDDQSLAGQQMPDSIGQALQEVRSITFPAGQVDLIIDKPENNFVDVLLVYHGTVWYDSLILNAAYNTLEGYRRLLTSNDMMLVSVAYPEENLLFGDNIAHSEAALKWVKDEADTALGIKVGKIFLSGHSQGGYLVTRLNTMHQTAGVVANGPGPLNLVFRCQLEENGTIPSGYVCTQLNNTYGPTSQNPDAYMARSLLEFTDGHLSDILFVQGMNDSPIQMHSWPIFKTRLESCSDCAAIDFLEIPNAGHSALYQTQIGKQAFNTFIQARR